MRRPVDVTARAGGAVDVKSVTPVDVTGREALPKPAPKSRAQATTQSQPAKGKGES